LVEHLARDVGGVFAGIVLLTLFLFALIWLRRRLLERRGGTVECSLRTLAADGEHGPWRLGIGRYKGDELHWHRVFEVRRRPRQVITRRGLVVSNRRGPAAEEASELGADARIIEVRDGELRVELAMSAAALTGFLAWLEAAPPGFPVELS
jgi:hypothetical protein